LASLIADIEALGTGATDDQMALRVRAEGELRANVGSEETERMILELIAKQVSCRMSPHLRTTTTSALDLGRPLRNCH
jgi:hypothetical protein